MLQEEVIDDVRVLMFLEMMDQLCSKRPVLTLTYKTQRQFLLTEIGIFLERSCCGVWSTFRDRKVLPVSACWKGNYFPSVLNFKFFPKLPSLAWIGVCVGRTGFGFQCKRGSNGMCNARWATNEYLIFGYLYTVARLWEAGELKTLVEVQWNSLKSCTYGIIFHKLV